MKISVDAFQKTIKTCRSRETSGDSEKRSEKNPSYRQCLVTALLANEVLGLDVYAEKIILENGFRGYHYFNKDYTIPVRFCDEQFLHEHILAKKPERYLDQEKLEIITLRDPSIIKKYEILKQRFQTEIEKIIRI